MKVLSHFLRFNLLIACFCCLFSCGNSKSIILQGLNQNAANQVLVKLGVSNIEATRTIEKGGTYAITVNTSDRVAALTILEQNGLPGKPVVTLGDEFQKDGFISSPLEEQARFIYALEAQITDMISLIDGVSNVSVQITLPPPSDNMLQAENVKPAASILVKFKQGYHLEVYTTRIKQLVANSVPGLTPDRVEVLFISQEDTN